MVELSWFGCVIPRYWVGVELYVSVSGSGSLVALIQWVMVVCGHGGLT